MRRPSGSFPALLDQLRDEPRPSRLVARAEAGAVVAVEVLVEEDEVAPVRVLLELLAAAVDRAAAVAPAQEDVREAARELRGDLPQVQEPPRAGRELHLE